MHISDGVAGPALNAGVSALSFAMAAYSLRKTGSDRIPRVAIVTAAFFTASLIHVKIGVTSAHLVLNGLAGILLGVSSFISISVALALQALMFQHGGITAIGINAFIMGFPALIGWGMYSLVKKAGSARWGTGIAGFAAGFTAVAASAVLTAVVLWLSGKEFIATAKLVIMMEIPISIVEGLITSFVILFLLRVKPDIIYEKDGI